MSGKYNKMEYKKLIAARKLKGFTQEKLATQIAEQTTLSRKERGLSPISDEEWQRIAMVLKVPVDEIKESFIENSSQNVNCTFTDQSVGIQYVTVPTEILESLLKAKDEQITLLKELLNKK